MDAYLKSITKKFTDLQTKYKAQCDKLMGLKKENKKLEAEKVKLSQKWVRLSTKNAQEDKMKDKIKEIE